MVAQEYSQRLGTLTQAHFQAALDRFGLGRFLRAGPVPLGLSEHVLDQHHGGVRAARRAPLCVAVNNNE